MVIVKRKTTDQAAVFDALEVRTGCYMPPCMSVRFLSSWITKCQTNPQCSAAGGERCLRFLISLLRKKLQALSHVPSASGDSMTHTVVLV